MDTPPERTYDDLTLLASRVCDTPISLISLLDRKRQWFKSRHGIDATETPIEQAFCAHAIKRTGIFEVSDATRDERFAKNPLVTGEPHIRFYAGVTLQTERGVAVGTLCVVDRSPRALDDEQREALSALARQVMSQLELRRTNLRLEKAVVEREQARSELQALKGVIPICCYCKKIRDDKRSWHQLEAYLAQHVHLEFSHGICPSCYPSVLEESGIYSVSELRASRQECRGECPGESHEQHGPSFG